MNQPDEQTLNDRVLVLAPTAGDTTLSETFLREAGFVCNICSDTCALGQELEQGAGALLLSEEVLADSDSHCFVDALRQQPKWSDVPILLLTGEGANSPPSLGPGNARQCHAPGAAHARAHPRQCPEDSFEGRRQQYELRNQMEALRESEERFRLMANSSRNWCGWPVRMATSTGITGAGMSTPVPPPSRCRGGGGSRFTIRSNF